MNRSRGRFSRALAFLLALGFASLAAHAQHAVEHLALNPHNVDGMSLGAPVGLGARWLAHQGDNPAWAEPGFDDSHWQVVKLEVPLAQQGMKGVDAVWYRLHVRIPPNARHMSLMLTRTEGSLEIYANGALIGGWGSQAPGGSRLIITSWTGAIPDAVLGSGDLTIAIRARIGNITHGGDIPVGPLGVESEDLLGPAPAIRNAAALLSFRDLTSNWTNLTLVLILLLITAALALAIRSESEYQALLVALAGQATHQGLILWTLIFGTHITFGYGLLFYGVNAVWIIGLIEFVRLILGIRRSRAFLIYYALLGVVSPLVGIWSYLYWLPHHALNGPLIVAASLFTELIGVPATAGLPLLALWVAWRKRNRDALLLFMPLLINASWVYYSFGLYLLRLFHVITEGTYLTADYTPITAFNIAWDEVVSFAFSISLLVFLVVRTIRLAREKARAASEMQAVKTLQGLLLVRSQQATPGYAVETVYRPASEVGGDFFLVSPHSDGSIVAIVGDVSGKGLLAAMRVSLILGALNRETSRIPAEVLSRLNQVLLGQSDMGFTTACCVRVEANGDYSFSNAGHLNPYIDGQEIEAPGVLPLGLKPDQAYTTVTGHLNPGQRMVLLSDGVPEARSKRQLLGFDKLLELTRLGASEIADAAQSFGQEDDITVLALALA
jgi:phosphoserine phosphatase RsbU/P